MSRARTGPICLSFFVRQDGERKDAGLRKRHDRRHDYAQRCGFRLVRVDFVMCRGHDKYKKLKSSSYASVTSLEAAEYQFRSAVKDFDKITYAAHSDSDLGLAKYLDIY